MDNTKKKVRPMPPVAMNEDLARDIQAMIADCSLATSGNDTLVDTAKLIMQMKSYISRRGNTMHHLGYTTAEKEMAERGQPEPPVDCLPSYDMPGDRQ